MELDAVHAAVRNCADCALSQTRKRAVPGEGAAGAVVMFIGEAPGKQEDETGRPFVGAAGRLLDKLLADAGINRDEVFITSILKCRPPNNRNPRAGEICACQKHLQAQINAVNPRIICPLGNFALKTLLGGNRSIKECHGRLLHTAGRTYLPMYHPAAALYNRSLHGALAEDMRLLRRLNDNTDN
ncbi:MAG: uracil-DNA glycosylase [bacterium]|jgi:uracil-DNA glycosylase family 4